MRELKRVVTAEDAEELPEAKKYSKKFEVQAIVGEKGMTRRTKQYKVLWSGFDSTTWEPAANVDHCAEKIKEWFSMKPEEQHRLEMMSDEELVAELAEVAALQTDHEAAAAQQRLQLEEVLTQEAASSARQQQQQRQEEELCDIRYKCLPCAVQHTSSEGRINRSQEAESRSTPVQRVAAAERTTPATAETVKKEAVQQQDPRKATQPATTKDVHVEEEIAQQPEAGQAIQMNLLPELQLTGLIAKVMKLAGYSMDQLRATVASPPCETFSLADASNISRGNYYRDHQDHTKPPRQHSRPSRGRWRSNMIVWCGILWSRT